MLRHFFVGLLLTAIAVAPASGAIPSYRGYTGLMIIPTADALAKGDWNIGVMCEDVNSGTINDYIANYGIAQNFEIGLSRYRFDENQSARTLLNFKYAFMPETEGHPGVAAGVFDLTNDLETTVYVAASKSLGERLDTWEGEILAPRVHAGFGGGRLRNIFVGLSAFIGNRAQLVTEWDSQTVQLGARFRLTPLVTIHLGGFNLAEKTGVSSGARDKMTFGTGISFNKSY